MTWNVGGLGVFAGVIFVLIVEGVTFFCRKWREEATFKDIVAHGIKRRVMPK